MTYIKNFITLVLAINFINACGVVDGPSYIYRNERSYFENGQAAEAVLLQADFTSAATGLSQSLWSTFQSMAFDDQNNLYVADNGNRRVLVFASGATQASYVVGQSNFTSSASALTATGMSSPETMRVGGGKLFVADRSNSRVLVYSTPIGANTPSASVVIGQADKTTNGGNSQCLANSLGDPFGLSYAAGKLAIASSNENRIMLYNSIPGSDSASVSVVLGQTVQSGTCTSGVTQSKINRAKGVWTDGTRVAVADSNNDRILIWNSWPTTDGQNADLVLGQSNFTSTGSGLSASEFSNPWGIASNGTMLALADYNNNRVLLWLTFPTTDNQPADVVLGQTDFTTADWPASPTAQNMNGPTDVTFVGDELYVADSDHYRVLKFKAKVEVLE